MDLKSIHRFSPSDPKDEFEFFYHSFYRTKRLFFLPAESGFRPPTDVYETQDEVVILMDIAGISSSSIRVTLTDNLLTIRGIRKPYPEGEKRHYHKMEIDFGPFERHIELPARIDPDRVTHHYLYGFLEIRLPKIDTTTSGQAIPIDIDL